MTTAEIIKAQAITHKAHKAYSHKVWKDRQTAYQQIKERDCYGYKSAKVQNMDGSSERGIKA